MPKSKREKVLHLSQVGKKTREHKDRLFAHVRDAVPEYQHCFVVRVDNLRNQHLQDLRQEMRDSRLFLGKTKLMARALGTTPEDALAPGIDRLAGRYLHGTVGLLFSNRAPADVRALLDALSPVDFARAGAVAPRDVVVPRGPLYSTGGTVPAADDVPMPLALEPELRRLGVPTRLLRGKVVLEEAPESADNADNDDNDNADADDGYVICRAGQTLDGRQTRLLRLFGICLCEFRVAVLAYWSAASGEVTELVPPPTPAKAATAAAAAAARKAARSPAASDDDDGADDVDVDVEDAVIEDVQA